MSTMPLLDQVQLAAAISGTPTLPFPPPPPSPDPYSPVPATAITTAVVNQTQSVLTFEDQSFNPLLTSSRVDVHRDGH